MVDEWGWKVIEALVLLGAIFACLIIGGCVVGCFWGLGALVL